MKKLFSFLVIMVLYACNYSSIEDQNSSKPEIAVNSFFANDSIIKLKVCTTTNLFTESNQKGLSFDIKIINETSNEFLTSNVLNDSVYFLHTANNINPNMGDILKIEIQDKNTNYKSSASDTIPSSHVDFKLVKTSFKSCALYGGNNEINIQPYGVIKFLPSSKNSCYYELIVSIIEYGIGTISYTPRSWHAYLESTSNLITSEDYYPSNPIVNDRGVESLIFKCQNITDSISVDFSYFTSILSTETDYITANYDLTIELREVSYNYYKYLTSLYSQKSVLLGNSIYGNPGTVTVYSNIINGTGIFASYTSTDTTIHIESVTYPRNTN